MVAPAKEGMDAGSIMLPEQHEDQLQLGFKMIQNAYNSKVFTLEQENRSLRLSCEEQKGHVTTLQRRTSSLEVELGEARQRQQQLGEENKELFKTVQQFRRQIQRLEGLKKKVMDSIADVGSDGGEQCYLNDDYLKVAAPLTVAAVTGEGRVPPLPSLPTRSSSPAPDEALLLSTPASHRGLSGSSPSAGPVAPPLPPASDGAVQDTPQVPPTLDGKEFFRLARSYFTSEAFNEFLANIRKLNNRDQSREQTLHEVHRIFGPDLHHLSAEFEQLLVLHPVA